MVVDHSLFKYNILFKDDEITLSDVPSGVHHESSVVLDSYAFYSNPLWCEYCPPKDGNLFLEDESTLVGKDHNEKEGGICFPITFSSWCVSILNGMTNDPEPISSHTYENTLDEVDLRDTFLYYLFTYDDAHTFEWSMLLEDKSANWTTRGALDPSSWIAFPFDPSSELNCVIYVGMLGRNGRHNVGEIVDTFPYDGKSFSRVSNPFEEPTLCMGKGSFLHLFCYSHFEHDLVDCASYRGRRYLPREGEVCTFLYYLFAYDESPSCIKGALRVDQGITEQGLDSRTQFYLPAYDDTYACVGSIFYVSSGINRANKSLIDPMLCNHFPFDPGVGFKCVEYGSNTVYHSYDSYLVLLLDPMCLNEVCLPIWVGNTCVLEPAHELGIITLLKLSSALDEVLIWVNITYAFALRYESVHVLLDLKEELCLFECGTNEGLHVWFLNCISSFALPLCQSFLSSQLSIVLMSYKPFVNHFDAWLYVKFVHPWHGDEIVIANANPHAMRTLLLFAFPMVWQGLDSRTNPFQERENDAIQIASRPLTHSQAWELHCIEELFTRMEALGLALVENKGFHALMITWVLFGEPGLVGGSPKGLGDEPSSPKVPEPGKVQDPSPTQWADS
ncbi:hypothetical protein KY285_007988 [Solanum tuberosum]|nr:hypothetical protein KY285_007988 [Solanum tuberosum]